MNLPLQSWVVVLLLLFVQGCTTAKFDVVLPSITPGHGWSLDASNWLVYKESFWGPRFTMFVSPNEKGSKPIRIQLTLHSSYREHLFSLDLRKTKLRVNNQTYTPSATTCILPTSRIDGDVVLIDDLPLNATYPCLYLLFHAPLADWTNISLHLDGLFKGSENLVVPEIRFNKTKRARPGSFVGAVDAKTQRQIATLWQSRDISAVSRVSCSQQRPQRSSGYGPACYTKTA